MDFKILENWNKQDYFLLTWFIYNFNIKIKKSNFFNIFKKVTKLNISKVSIQSPSLLCKNDIIKKT
jgi:hypothetical protein